MDETCAVPVSVVEEWRPVVGWEGVYSVSSMGRVRAEDRLVPFPDGRVRRYRQRVLSDRLINSGYLTAALWYAKIPSYRLVHHLVTEAFIGPIPTGLQVNHKNGIKRDNRVCNLEIVTAAENVAHSVRLGLAPRGEDSVTSKLRESQVAEIRSRYADGGVSQMELAAEFGVQRGTIGKIVRGERWAHIPGGNKEYRRRRTKRAA